jgi:hypothetical protein
MAMDENPYRAPDGNEPADGERILPPLSRRRRVGRLSALFVAAAVYLGPYLDLIRMGPRGSESNPVVCWVAAAVCILCAYLFQRRPPATQS